MQVIADKNQISEDVFDFMISYLPFPQKSIRSELAKLFSISILNGARFSSLFHFRLSKIAGDQLKTNNPNITDLSDEYRPTNLGRHFAELYDNEWSDAYEEVQRDFQNEMRSIELLHNIVKVIQLFI